MKNKHNFVAVVEPRRCSFCFNFNFHQNLPGGFAWNFGHVKGDFQEYLNLDLVELKLERHI